MGIPGAACAAPLQHTEATAALPVGEFHAQLPRRQTPANRTWDQLIIGRCAAASAASRFRCSGCRDPGPTWGGPPAAAPEDQPVSPAHQQATTTDG
eukprot:12054053-Alexandrium_andersonii.AAC.1